MHGPSSLTTSASLRRARRFLGRRLDSQRRESGQAPRWFCWISPTERWWLEAYGFCDIDVLFAISGEAIAGDGQAALRLHHPLGRGEPHYLTIKREMPSRWRGPLAALPPWGKATSRARREFEILRRLLLAGIACPQPLVCIEQGLFPKRACLLLEEPIGARPLNAVLAEGLLATCADRREAFFRLLGRDVARLHAKAIHHAELYAGNVLVSCRDQQWHIGIRNFDRSGQYRQLRLRHRTGDLAALLATLPDRLAGATDRENLLDAYVAESQLADCSLQLRRAVQSRVERLLAQRRIWEIRENDTVDGANGRRAAAACATTLWIDPEYRGDLEKVGLASFDGIMNATHGRHLRSLKDRENWRFEFAHRHEKRAAYLKKHRARTLASRMRAALGRGPGQTAGRVEARSIAELNRAGIAAMRLIAFGERLSPDGRLESFVLTEELAGYTQLDLFLKNRFTPLALRQAGEQAKHLRALIHYVADVAARFHRLGYNHRDLYCCHFFIHEPAPGRFKVNLIDLQRVEHRRRWRRRWIVKDLAQLAYSAPRDYISCTARLYFMKRYLGVSRLRPRDKRLIRQVLAKQKLMEWQLGKQP
jgi:heptose I phosphotransferase